MILCHADSHNIMQYQSEMLAKGAPGVHVLAHRRWRVSATSCDEAKVVGTGWEGCKEGFSFLLLYRDSFILYRESSIGFVPRMFWAVQNDLAIHS